MRSSSWWRWGGPTLNPSCGPGRASALARRRAYSFEPTRQYLLLAKNRHDYHSALRVSTGPGYPRVPLDREWDGLARHRDFSDLPLDNNTAERALRTPVIGRKNYYGAQATWAAHLAAAVWTISTTAQRNNLEPLTYLTNYLTAYAGGTPPQDQALDQFLPWLSRPDPTPTTNGIRPDP